jgi:hypothetical protein
MCSLAGLPTNTYKYHRAWNHDISDEAWEWVIGCSGCFHCTTSSSHVHLSYLISCLTYWHVLVPRKSGLIFSSLTWAARYGMHYPYYAEIDVHLTGFIFHLGLALGFGCRFGKTKSSMSTNCLVWVALGKPNAH